MLNRVHLSEKKSHVKKYKADFLRNSQIYNIFRRRFNKGLREIFRGFLVSYLIEIEALLKFF